METKEGIKFNKYGQSIVSSKTLMNLLLEGRNINNLNVVFDEDIELYQEYQNDLLDKNIVFYEPPEEKQSLEEFHETCTQHWLFPKEYQSIDVLKWLLDKCKNPQEEERVQLEYKMYEERDLIMVLRLFIFLVDYMRNHGFIWGVGRGSSVASFILYLIGIHRINSVKYNLDINEYLK